jgi:hypothetical protein
MATSTLTYKKTLGDGFFTQSINPEEADTSAPIYLSAYINKASAGNNVLELEFDDTINSPSTNYELGFTVECRVSTGAWKTLPATTYTSAVSGSFIVFTFNSGTVKTFQGSHEIGVSYDKSVGDITDDAGNILASFTRDTTLTNSSSVDLLENLRSVWSMDTSVLGDDSIENLDLTTNNGVTRNTTGGKLGTGCGAFVRSSSQELSESNTRLITSGNFTVAGWFNQASGLIVANIFCQGINRILLRITSENKAQIYINDLDGGVKSITGSDVLTVDGTTWYHVAARFDGSYLGLFINGAETGSAVSGSTIDYDVDASNNTVLGANNAGSANNFDGLLDEMTGVRSAWSDTEIEDHYNSSNGKQYPFIPDHVGFDLGTFGTTTFD